MEVKSNGFLKIAGILMIVFGSIVLILGIIGLVAVIAFAALGASDALLTIGALLVLVSAVVQLIAGILGIKNAAKPNKAMTCIVWGLLTVVFAVLGQVFTVAAGGDFGIASLGIGLVIPALYLVGAFQNKSRA